MLTMKTKGVVRMILFTLVIVMNHQCRSLPVDMKWNGENTGISAKINNDGYFKFPLIRDAFVFYDDGTIVQSSEVPNDTADYYGGPYPSGCYYEKEFDRWEGGASGLYRVEGDTIYANLYFRNGFYFGLKFQIKFITSLWRMKFRIIDRNTIVLCEECEYHKYDSHVVERNDTLCYWPASQLPPPNTEFKNKRRFWEKGKRPK